MGASSFNNQEKANTQSQGHRSYGLGFSQKTIARRCNTLIHGPRFSNSRFKSVGKAVMTKVTVVNGFKERQCDLTKQQQRVAVFGGMILLSEIHPFYIFET